MAVDTPETAIPLISPVNGCGGIWGSPLNAFVFPLELTDVQVKVAVPVPVEMAPDVRASTMTTPATTIRTTTNAATTISHRDRRCLAPPAPSPEDRPTKSVF